MQYKRLKLFAIFVLKLVEALGTELENAVASLQLQGKVSPILQLLLGSLLMELQSLLDPLLQRLGLGTPILDLLDAVFTLNLPEIVKRLKEIITPLGLGPLLNGALDQVALLKRSTDVMVNIFYLTLIRLL